MVDVDQGWQHLHDNFIKALDKVAPIIIMNNVKQRKCWTTLELMSLIRERDHKKATADALLNNKDNEEFKKIRNKVKRLIIKSKRAYILNK